MIVFVQGNAIGIDKILFLSEVADELYSKVECFVECPCVDGDRRHVVCVCILEALEFLKKTCGV